jgi:hypothetical protein
MSEGGPRRKRLPLRWLSLAELVGITAVVIAALGYWDTHRERAQTDRERAAEAREKQAEARAGVLKLAFLMTGTPESGGDRLRLATVHSEQVIQTQAVTFPAEIRGDAVQTTGNPRIEAGWFEAGLAKALHVRDDKRHQGRLPIGIATSFIEDGQPKTDQAIYLIGYSTHPRVLRSDKVEMEGLSLVRRGVGGDLQPAVDALWTKQNPPPAKP